MTQQVEKVNESYTAEISYNKYKGKWIQYSYIDDFMVS